jgi:hypothetical protein
MKHPGQTPVPTRLIRQSGDANATTDCGNPHWQVWNRPLERFALGTFRSGVSNNLLQMGTLLNQSQRKVCHGLRELPVDAHDGNATRLVVVLFTGAQPDDGARYTTPRAAEFSLAILGQRLDRVS